MGDGCYGIQCMMINNIFERYENLAGLVIHSDQGWHYRTEKIFTVARNERSNAKHVQKRKLSW